MGREQDRPVFRIRRAVHADAPEILRVHLASIRTLCSRDYRPDEIEAWTHWKKPENYDAPIRTSDFYVAEVADTPNDAGTRTGTEAWRIVGFGALSVPGAEVKGLYFHPEVAGRGIGAEMVRHLFALARAAGLKELIVRSTLTAEAFYARMGFAREEAAHHEFPGGVRVASVKMRRIL